MNGKQHKMKFSLPGVAFAAVPHAQAIWQFSISSPVVADARLLCIMLSAGLLRARAPPASRLGRLQFPQLWSRSLKVSCMIDGDRELFQVDVNDGDTLANIRDKIKMEAPRQLPHASTLSLYKAPEGEGFTEPGVTVGAQDEITSARSLRALFTETNAARVIVRPPDYRRGLRNIFQYDCRSGDLVWKKDTFRSFPVHAVSDFRSLRESPEFCFFDKTAFISALASFDEPALVFLRPPRSGKSLGLSTLAHFHGRQHLPDYKALFKGLAIDDLVEKKRIFPGRYFVLRFDLSTFDRSSDKKVASRSLNLMLNRSIKWFYSTYEPYLRIPANVLIERTIREDASLSLRKCANVVREILSNAQTSEDPLSKIEGIYLMADAYDSFGNEYLVPKDRGHWRSPRETQQDSLLKRFWASVKSSLGKGIARCYITGVSPLSLADKTSRFNVARYVSWEPNLAGFCGLTDADLAAALARENVCGPTSKAKKHLKIMKDHYNGFNFVLGGRGPLTYNTNTCLEYLQSLAEKSPINPLYPLHVTNSGALDRTLQIMAASPVATKLIEDGLFNGNDLGKKVEKITIPFDNIGQTFTLKSLARKLAECEATWLSYMVHIGGLTFCARKKALRFPNLVVAARFGKAILRIYDAYLEDVDGALKLLIEEGDIDRIFGLYVRGMQRHDVVPRDFKKNGEQHCNSMRFAFLANIHPSFRRVGIKTTVTKLPGNSGRIIMLVSIPMKKQLFVLEWKSIPIDCIGIGSGSSSKRANTLMDIQNDCEVLKLKFKFMNDKWRAGQTIKEWIENGPQDQLRDYTHGKEIQKWREDGYSITSILTIVVGSRHILLWNLVGDKLDDFPRLALEW